MRSWPEAEIAHPLNHAEAALHLSTPTGQRKSARLTFHKSGIGFFDAGTRALSRSIAFSSDCRLFQKSRHRSPFFSSRAKNVFRLNFSGRRFARSSPGKTGVETGAFGNARTAYGAASGRPIAFWCKSIKPSPPGP